MVIPSRNSDRRRTTATSSAGTCDRELEAPVGSGRHRERLRAGWYAAGREGVFVPVRMRKRTGRRMRGAAGALC